MTESVPTPEVTSPESPAVQTLSTWEVKLNEIFGKKAPQLPDNVKEFIVKYGPYIDLVMLVLSLPLILTALGLGALATPLMILGGGSGLGGMSLSMIFLIITVALQIMALPGLFKRALGAWRLMFYSSLVSALYSLFSLSWGSLIIGTAISFYFLFQIRSYYK